MTTDEAIWQIEGGDVYTVEQSADGSRYTVKRAGKRAKNVRNNGRDGMTEAQLRDFAAQVVRERDRVADEPWAKALRRLQGARA